MPSDGSGPLSVLGQIRDVLEQILATLQTQQDHAEVREVSERTDAERPDDPTPPPPPSPWRAAEEQRQAFASSLRDGMESARTPVPRDQSSQPDDGQGLRRWNATANLLSSSGLGELAGLMNSIKGFADAVREFGAAWSGSGRQQPARPAPEPRIEPQRLLQPVPTQNPLAPLQAVERPQPTPALPVVPQDRREPPAPTADVPVEPRPRPQPPIPVANPAPQVRQERPTEPGVLPQPAVRPALVPTVNPITTTLQPQPQVPTVIVQPPAQQQQPTVQPVVVQQPAPPVPVPTVNPVAPVRQERQPTPTVVVQQPAAQRPVPVAPPAVQQPLQPTPVPTVNPVAPVRQERREPVPTASPVQQRREDYKQPGAGSTVPAVVSTQGPAPAANLIPTTIPVEMQTGPNLSRMVPTTNPRPFLGGLPALGGGLTGGGQFVPTTPLLTGTQTAGRPSPASGGGGEGGHEMLEAARRLSRASGQLSEAARRERGDTVELSDNWMPGELRGLLTPSAPAPSGVPSLLGQMPSGPAIAAEKKAGEKKEDNWLSLENLAAIARFLGS